MSDGSISVWLGAIRCPYLTVNENIGGRCGEMVWEEAIRGDVLSLAGTPTMNVR